MRIALIPARGGSKRLHRKNITSFAGRPMLAWTVEAAKTSKLFDAVVVSTEDAEIAGIARNCSATVLLRPNNLATDVSTLIDVIHHVLAEYESVTEICVLLANCPLRPSEEITRSEKIWSILSPPALLSVVDYSWTPPFRAHSIDDNHRIRPLMPEWMDKKSQFYPQVVCPSGAIYWARASALEASSSLYIDGICGFPMPWHLAIDIDTPDDLRLAECIRFSLDHGFEFKVNNDA